MEREYFVHVSGTISVKADSAESAEALALEYLQEQAAESFKHVLDLEVQEPAE